MLRSPDGGAALNPKASRANVFIMAPEMVGDVWQVRSQTLGRIQTDSRVDLTLSNLYDEIDEESELTSMEVDVVEDSLNNLLDYYEYPSSSSASSSSTTTTTNSNTGSASSSSSSSSSSPRVIRPETANQFMNVFCKLLDPKRGDVGGKFRLATTLERFAFNMLNSQSGGCGEDQLNQIVESPACPLVKFQVW